MAGELRRGINVNGPDSILRGGFWTVDKETTNRGIKMKLAANKANLRAHAKAWAENAVLFSHKPRVALELGKGYVWLGSLDGEELEG